MSNVTCYSDAFDQHKVQLAKNPTYAVADAAMTLMDELTVTYCAKGSYPGYFQTAQENGGSFELRRHVYEFALVIEAGWLAWDEVVHQNRSTPMDAFDMAWDCEIIPRFISKFKDNRFVPDDGEMCAFFTELEDECKRRRAERAKRDELADEAARCGFRRLEEYELEEAAAAVRDWQYNATNYNAQYVALLAKADLGNRRHLVKAHPVLAQGHDMWMAGAIGYSGEIIREKVKEYYDDRKIK